MTRSERLPVQTETSRSGCPNFSTPGLAFAAGVVSILQPWPHAPSNRLPLRQWL